MRRSLDEESFWVVVDFFLGGVGEGKRTRQGKYCRVVFTGDARVQTAPFFYVIYYILSSGGFATSCERPSGTDPDPRCPGQHALFKLGQLDDPLPHTEDSEGSAAPRSATDSTEQWVWCIMHMRLCYMLFLLYV